MRWHQWACLRPPWVVTTLIRAQMKFSHCLPWVSTMAALPLGLITVIVFVRCESDNTRHLPQQPNSPLILHISPERPLFEKMFLGAVAQLFGQVQTTGINAFVLDCSLSFPAGTKSLCIICDLSATILCWIRFIVFMRSRRYQKHRTLCTVT